MLSGVRDFVKLGHPQIPKSQTTDSLCQVMTRALAAVRLSVKTDETTSPERQEHAIGLKIAQLGGELVGTASDLNVSASKVQPFLRPQLGEWLNNRVDEYDTIVWWRMDRAIRSMTDLHRLVAWAQENRKRLVFCEGHGSEYDFDFTSGNDKKSQSMALMLATIIAWAAQIESEAISERVTSSHAYLRKRGEWGGGMVPYGFLPERIEGQARGWRLVRNEATYPTVRWIVERVLDHAPLLGIANELNKRGVLTPRDWWESYKKKEPKGRKWTTQGLKSILTSRALLGESVHDGRLVADDSGEPIARGPAIVTEAEWAEIKSALVGRAMLDKNRYSESNALLGVAFCARCGEPYYVREDRAKGSVYRTLSCRSRHGEGESCGQPTISMLYAQEALDQMTMSLIGGQAVTRRRYVAGDDRSEELAFLHERMSILREEFYAGLFTGTKDEYFGMLRGFQEKIAVIGPEPVRKARYEYVETGKTYEQLWPDLNVQSRRTLLLELGVKVYLGRGDASFAEAKYIEEPADGTEHRRWLVASVDDVGRMLSAVQDGKRVKKDFQAWFHQSNEQSVADVLA